MKSIIGASIMALLLVCLALPSLVLAGAEGSTATGSFKFDLTDGETRFVEFNATQQTDGQATGEMTFSDPVAVPVEDPDAEEKPNSPGVLVRAKFDCLSVVENRAVMSGEIFESNVPSNIGLRVLLVIEDNGTDGVKDRVTWGVYKNPETGWTPQDAEVDDDKGASLTWWATDFERSDDKGVPSNLSKMVACKSFPLASYEFPEIKGSSGDLVVR
jgi:hypothetical protein